MLTWQCAELPAQTKTTLLSLLDTKRIVRLTVALRSCSCLLTRCSAHIRHAQGTQRRPSIISSHSSNTTFIPDQTPQPAFQPPEPSKSSFCTFDSGCSSFAGGGASGVDQLSHPQATSAVHPWRAVTGVYSYHATGIRNNTAQPSNSAVPESLLPRPCMLHAQARRRRSCRHLR